MNAIDPIDLSIEFVKAQVDPGGGGGAEGSAAAQTGDFYIWAILAIVFVGIFAFCMFNLIRYCNKKLHCLTNQTSVSSKSFVKPNIFLSSVLMIIAVVGLWFSFIASTSTAFANWQKNSIDFKPDKIQVTINEETGEATCDPFEFVNNTSDTYIFKNSELVLSEDAKMVSAEEDWDLTLNAIGLNSNLFDGQPGPYNIDLDVIKPLNPGYTSAATLNFNKIDIDIAQKLIGKKVFTLTLTPYQNIVNIPEASSFTFDNKPHTGVESGEGYTLTGTSIATDAGTYDVTASLKAGMIWSDKTTEDKKFEWAIAPFNVVLEFDVGPEGYSVHYGDAWPASAEEVKIISKQELPEDFTKIFASGISISHSYEPVISQAGSQITVSIVKPETNKNYTTTYSDTAILNVLKRDVKIDWDEDTCTVTYDAKEHWPDYELSGAYKEERPQITLTAKNIMMGQTETPVAVGEYEITASLSDNPINRNYQLVSDVEHPITCVLTINEKPAASAYWKVEGTTLSLSPTKIEGYTKDEDILKGFGSPEDAPWEKSLDSITNVEILEGESNAKIKPSKMTYLFAGLSKLENVDGLSYIDTSTVKDMNHLFHDDQSITILDLSSFNTSQATNMSALFQDTYKLENITLSSNFTTSLNTNFSSMFSDCGYSTTSGVTINNFKESITTTNAIDMSNMFFHANFATIDLSGFATSKVTNFSGMFQDFQLQDSTELDLTSFSNASATNIELMFSDCANLTTICADPAKWVPKSYELTSNAFNNCSLLVGISEYGAHQTAYADNPGEYNDGSYARVDVDDNNRGLFSSENTEEAKAFWGYSESTKILSLCSSYSSKTPKSDDDILGGFYSTSKLPWIEHLDEITSVEILPGVNDKKLDFTSMQNLFAKLSNCTTISGLNTETINFECLESMKDTFYKSGLTSIDLSAADTSHVTDMFEIFGKCTKLESINLTGNFSTGAVTTLSEAFEQVGADTVNGVEILFGGKCTTSNVYSMTAMFQNAKFKYGILDISTFTNSNKPEISQMFDTCENLKTIFADPKLWTRDYQFQRSTVFKNCNLLEGTSKSGYRTIHGSGSTYDYSEYAYICEGENEPGLFTPSPETTAYWGLRDNNATLYLCSSPTENANNEDWHILYGFSLYKAPWSAAFGTIKKVVIETGDNDKQLECISMNKLFANLSSCTEISGLQNIDTSVVSDMSSLFFNCKKLQKLTFEEAFNTENVIDMSYMFSGCEYLSILDLCMFDTHKVTNMNFMFYGCISLATIYIKDDNKFVTTAVTSGDSMFYCCYAIQGGAGTKYDVSHIDSTYARIDKGSESGTPGYFTKDILSETAYWKQVGNDDRGYVLYLSPDKKSDEYKEENRIVTGFTHQVSIRPWSEKKIHSVVFEIGDSGEKLTPKSMSYLFYNSLELTSVDLTNVDTHLVTSISGLFCECESLNTLTFPENFYTGNVTDMADLFSFCISMRSLDLSMFDTSKVTDMSRMFRNCKKLEAVDLSSFDTHNVVSMYYMFDSCEKLTSLDLSTFDTSKVTDMNAMFTFCYKLATIYVKDSFVTTSVTVDDNMFNYCSAIQGGAGTKFKGITKEYARIDHPECDAPGYFTNKVGYWKVENSTLHLAATNDSGRTYNEDEGLIFGFKDDQPWDPLEFTSIVVDKGVSGEKPYPKSMKNWFNNSKNVASIDLSNLNTIYVVSMECLFQNCNALQTLTLGDSFNTGNVTKMNNMFSSCHELPSLDLSNFETSNVSDMKNMFYDCISLSSLDLSSFNTNKTTDMSNMFNGCESVTSLNLSSFNTSNVSDMNHMFAHCEKINELDLSMFDTSKVTNMSGMFANCEVLTSLDFSNFNTSIVKDMSSMFSWCLSLSSITFSYGFNTGEVSNMKNMFYNCTHLVQLDIYVFDTQKVTDMSYMFFNCRALTSLDLHSFDTHKVTSMESMFYWCTSLTTIYASDKLFDTSAVTSDRYMFLDCKSLIGERGTSYNPDRISKLFARVDQGLESTAPGYFTELSVTGYWTISNETLYLSPSEEPGWKEEPRIITGFDELPPWDGEKVFDKVEVVKGSGGERLIPKSIKNWFNSSVFATSINLKELNTKNLTSMENLFLNCESLQAVEFGENFSTSKVVNMASMFSECKTLREIDLSVLDTSNVEDMNNLFSECKMMTSINLSTFNTHNVKNMSSIFSECEALGSVVFGNKFDTRNVTDMSSMFNNCHGLDTLDLSMFNTSNVVYMHEMFDRCSRLKLLSLGENFITGSVEDMSDMFMYCRAIDSLDLTTFDTSKVTNMQNMFYDCDNLTAIYVIDTFVTTSVSEVGGKDMFYGCENLQGCAGTKYSEAQVSDKSYARIDHPEVDKPGYFSNKVGFWKVNDGTLYLSPTDGEGYNADEGLLSGFDSCPTYKDMNFNNVVVEASWLTLSPRSMKNWFNGCKNITSIDFANLDTRYLTSMEGLFSGCEALATIDLSNFVTTNVTNMNSTFEGCTSLTSIYITDGWFNTDTVILSNNMFLNCNLLKGGKQTPYNPQKVDKEYARLDNGPKSGKPGYFSEKGSPSGFWMVKNRVLHLSPVQKTYEYEEDSRIISGFSDDSLTQPWNSQELTSVVIETGLYGEKLSPKSMSYWFNECSNVESISLTNLNTDSVTSMCGLFRNCKKLPAVNFPESFYTGNVINMYSMFRGCESLTSLNLSKFNTSKATDMGYMFYDCKALTSITLSSLFGTGNVTYMSHMFSDCQNLQAVDLRSFNTSKATDMDFMFSGCTSLIYLDLSMFDTRKVQYIDAMFSECEHLQRIFVNDTFVLTSVKKYCYFIFMNCYLLEGGAGTLYSEHHVDDMTYARIDQPDIGKPGYFTRKDSNINNNVLNLDSITENMNEREEQPLLSDLETPIDDSDKNLNDVDDVTNLSLDEDNNDENITEISFLLKTILALTDFLYFVVGIW